MGGKCQPSQTGPARTIHRERFDRQAAWTGYLPGVRFVGVLLLALACEASPNSHRRIDDALAERAEVWNECIRDAGGGTTLLFAEPLSDSYIACGAEADQLVPDAADYWECHANEVESSVECIEMLGCDSEAWDVCMASTCTLSDEAELDWTCTSLNCQWDEGHPRPTTPSHACEGWSPDGSDG